MPQSSILGPLFFLIYINNSSKDLSTNPKLFADDMSLFQLLLEGQLKAIFRKLNKTIGLIWELRNSLSRPSLMSLYISFIWSHLDYGYTIYHQLFNNSFQNKIEKIQYNGCLAITGSLLQQEEHLKKDFIRNQVLKAVKIVVREANFVIFTKLQLINLQTIY